MIKPTAKRNQRQRKKLKVDEYRQWQFFVKFNYDEIKTNLENDFDVIDNLYEIAENWNCWMYGFIGDGEAKMSFHNKRLLNDGIRCQLKIASYLMNTNGISGIKVGFKEFLE